MGAVNFISSLAADHPVVTVFFMIFLGNALVLGLMHEMRLLGECLILGVHLFKHELLAWREFLRRLRREITTWDTGEPTERNPEQ